jgi:hypothetical protein
MPGAISLSSSSHRTRNLLAVVPTYFVLCRQVLIGIVKIGRTYRFVLFNVGAWSPVRDHFGDHFVLWTFAIAMVARCRGSVWNRSS